MPDSLDSNTPGERPGSPDAVTRRLGCQGDGARMEAVSPKAGRGELIPRGGVPMAKDPVCGMTVDEKRAAATFVYQGQTYYFCAVACKEKFAKSPEKFVRPAATQ